MTEKWEYAVVRIMMGTDLQSALNGYGQEGWELVSINWENLNKTAYFKRRLESDRTP